MARRLFFVDQVQRGRAELTGDDAMHLTKVLRVEAGQRYEISDGETRYLAEVETARKSLVTFQTLEQLPSPTPPVRLHLLPALVKFDRLEWILEKACELGVERITPVIAERSEKGLEQAAAKRRERWLRVLRESSQQCRRVTLPGLDAPAKLRHALQQEGVRLFLDEESRMPITSALPARRLPSDEVHVLIGPEGGWVEHERRAVLEAGWTGVSLGPNILRAETAATAALAVIVAEWLTAETQPS